MTQLPQYNDSYKIATCSAFLLSVATCLVCPLLFAFDIDRWLYTHVMFPLVITPKAESIPGVIVAEVSDGGYESLVYTTLIIDGEWKMWLNVSTNPDFVTGGKFRVETVAGCPVYDDGFANLAEAVAYYRQHPELRQCK